MKFADGFWLTQRGYTVSYAVQPFACRVCGDTVSVTAASGRILHRSMTLGGVMLSFAFSSPRENVICVKLYHHKGTAGHMPEFAVSADPGFHPVITETADSITLTSGKTAVTVSKGDAWNIRYTYDGRRLTGSGAHAASYIHADAARTENALRSAADEPFWSIPPNKNGCFIREQLDLSVGEYVCGFGETFTPFVKNGQCIDIWNADGGTCTGQSYKSVPFYLSSRGYGIFASHTGHVSFEAASDTVSKVSMTAADESLTYYVIGGATCADVLQNYTGLTGKPALPPLQSFGLWLSTSFTTDYDEQTVCNMLDGMRKRQIPLSMFHFDCFWMQPQTWTSFQWDPAMFPDPQGMLKRIREQYGVGICVWINPYIAQASPLFDEAAGNGYLLRNTDGSIFQTDFWQSGMGIVDFTNPDACAWFADKIRGLCADGVDAVKTDFGERIPAKDVVWHSGADPAGMHNYYAYLYNKTVFSALEKCKGRGNAVLFARSATAGCQQFPVHWGGDCSATYSAMAETLRGGLSLTSSGFGFFSHDIGGFEQTASPDVYKRWIAFGLMSTHSRLHGSHSYRVPWLYEEDDPDDPENACAVLRFFTRLKIQLMPYLWAQANKTHETGIPMMRAMLLDFGDDPACLTLDRQYMLGDSLLCAPVMDESGEAEFYLPQGEWYDLLSGETVTGGRWLRRTYSYLEMPLYVRPDTVLVRNASCSTPCGDALQHADVLICGLADGHTAAAELRHADGSLYCTLTAERTGNRITLRCTEPGVHYTVTVSETGKCVRASESGTTFIEL